MARLDIQTSNALRQLKKQQRIDYEKTRILYHSLAQKRNQLKSKEDKLDLVSSYPEIAAKIFYHFDDRELAKLVIARYSTHTKANLREIAFYVKGELQRRLDERLEKILGMYTLPIADEQDDSEIYEGYLDIAERTLEEKGYQVK